VVKVLTFLCTEIFLTLSSNGDKFQSLMTLFGGLIGKVLNV
jgi:hypothetical protein